MKFQRQFFRSFDIDINTPEVHYKNPFIDNDPYAQAQSRKDLCDAWKKEQDLREKELDELFRGRNRS